MFEALLLLAMLPAAQGETSPRVVTAEIVVTAERGAEEREVLPAATSVLTRQTIEALPADDLADVIRILPGVTALLHGAGSRPMVTARGFFGGGEAEYVQLLVDGVPGGDPESGLAEWTLIPAESIERVEFLRGPASALYGDSALAGVIEVFTRSSGAGPAAHLSVETGTHNTHEATIAWRQHGRVGAGVSAAALRTDGYREHSATERLYAEGLVSFGADTSSVDVRLSASSLGREEPGMLPLELLGQSPRTSSELFRFDREESDRLRLSADYSRSGPLPVRVLGWASDRRSSLLRTVLLGAGIGDRVHRQTESRTYGSAITADYARVLGRRSHELRGGFDLVRDSVTRRYFTDENGIRGEQTASGDGARHRLGLFITDHFEVTAQTRVTVGVRYDSLRDELTTRATHDAWSPRAGVSFARGRGTPYVLFAQVARAFKAPTIDQLFDQRPYPDFTGGTFTVSNPELEPQRATNIEAGVRRATPALRWEVVGYRMQVDDEIDFDVATFSYRNIGETLHEGLEVSAEGRTRGIAPRASYAWTRAEARNGSHRGSQLKNIPEHAVHLGARLELQAGLQLDASLRVLSGWFLDDANTIAMDDSAQVDLRLRREFGRWIGRVDVVNAFDDVVPHVGALLPDFRGGEVPYAYPAAGRSIRVGAELRF